MFKLYNPGNKGTRVKGVAFHSVFWGVPAARVWESVIHMWLTAEWCAVALPFLRLVKIQWLVRGMGMGWDSVEIQNFPSVP